MVLLTLEKWHTLFLTIMIKQTTTASTHWSGTVPWCPWPWESCTLSRGVLHKETWRGFHSDKENRGDRPWIQMSLKMVWLRTTRRCQRHIHHKEVSGSPGFVSCISEREREKRKQKKKLVVSKAVCGQWKIRLPPIPYSLTPLSPTYRHKIIFILVQTRTVHSIWRAIT